jgi:hypothetical protein
VGAPEETILMVYLQETEKPRKVTRKKAFLGQLQHIPRKALVRMELESGEVPR